jgi:hypothetical protein
MRWIALIMICLMGISSAAAERIINDSGGRIEEYVARFTRAREAGERIVVEGQCLSACTLVLALLPRERICVTPNASFGFHAAWSPDWAGGAAGDSKATELMWKMYPPPIRNWIRAHGGLSQQMIYLRDPPLAAMYPACLPGQDRGGAPDRANMAKSQKRSLSTVRSGKRKHSQANSFSR